MDKNCNNGISRRSALKRMGLLIAGAACINMPTLTLCNMDTKKTHYPLFHRDRQLPLRCPRTGRRTHRTAQHPATGETKPLYP